MTATILSFKIWICTVFLACIGIAMILLATGAGIQITIATWVFLMMIMVALFITLPALLLLYITISHQNNHEHTAAMLKQLAICCTGINFLYTSIFYGCAQSSLVLKGALSLMLEAILVFVFLEIMAAIATAINLNGIELLVGMRQVEQAALENALLQNDFINKREDI